MRSTICCKYWSLKVQLPLGNFLWMFKVVVEESPDLRNNFDSSILLFADFKRDLYFYYFYLYLYFKPDLYFIIIIMKRCFINATNLIIYFVASSFFLVQISVIISGVITRNMVFSVRYRISLRIIFKGKTDEWTKSNKLFVEVTITL